MHLSQEKLSTEKIVGNKLSEFAWNSVLYDKIRTIILVI